YLQHPDVLFDRLAQVGPSGGTLTLAQSVQAHLEMFFLKGDPLLRYNLYPGRPWFDPVSGLLMLIGLVAALLLFLRRGDSGLRLAGVSVALAPLLILPSVIAVGGLPPSHMRSVAMVPLIFFAPALGVVWAMGIDRGEKQSSPPDLLSTVAGVPSGVATVERGTQPAYTHRAAPPLYGTPWRGGQGVRLILSAFLVLVGLNTWADYRAWAGRADLFYDSDGDMQAAAQWLEQNAAPDDLIYVYSRFYEHPTVLAHHVDHGQVRWVMHDQRFEPPPGQRAITIYPQSLIDADTRAQLNALPDRIDGPPAPDGRPAFVAVIGPGAPDSLCEAASLGGVLQPCFPSDFRPNAPAHIGGRLVWKVLRTPDRADLTPVIRIVDAWGGELAPRLYPYFDQSDRWRPGERITLDFDAPLDPTDPPGDYYAELSWFSRSDPAYFLPALDGDGAFAGVWQRVFLATVTPADAPRVPRGDTASLRAIRPGVYVVEAPTLPDRAEQGERLRFSVTWYADQAPGDVGPLTLLAAPADGGDPIKLWQGHPARGAFPMRDWAQYQSLADRYDVDIPPDMPPGRYTLRLDVPGGARPAFEHEIEIVAVQRSFDTPPDLKPLEYLLGPGAPMFQLAGYAAARDGDALAVRLAWRALAVPDRDYTVFVHVLNPDGSIFSQVDRQPAPPTSRWLIGQVVTESYALRTPDGPYQIEVGLYVQENGQRLAVTDGAGVALGDAIRLDGP
ncbi:MAG: hypothetical protein IT323_03275, partial [Anaerolineae bacterium]|nr:hypothetical protein [Anaerolineae bacterium]